MTAAAADASAASRQMARDAVREVPEGYEGGRPPGPGARDRLPEGVPADSFSARGVERYVECLDRYGKDLWILSRKIAKRANADVASPHHVDRANGALSQGRQRRAQLFQAVGSVLLGGTISLAVGAVTGAHQPETLLGIGIGTGAVGTGMLLYGAMR